MNKTIASMIISFAMATACFSGVCDAIECNYCGASEPIGETGCQAWFNGSGKGKVSCGVKSQLYKAITPIKIKSCYLVVGGDETNTEAIVVVSGIKNGVGEFTKELTCSEFKWNVFGKDSTKKSYTLGSEMFFQAADDENSIEVWGVLHGTVKVQVTGGCSPCGDDAAYKFTPNKFVGKFVGKADATGCACAREFEAVFGEGDCSNQNCLSFEETEDDKKEYFCGDITLKYDAKKSGYKFR